MIEHLEYYSKSISFCEEKVSKYFEKYYLDLVECKVYKKEIVGTNSYRNKYMYKFNVWDYTDMNPVKKMNIFVYFTEHLIYKDLDNNNYDSPMNIILDKKVFMDYEMKFLV